MVELPQDYEPSADRVTGRLESVSCMACGLTHDFNNILAAILTNTEAVLSQIPSDTKIRPYVDRIAANTRKAIALIERIQMFTENGAAEHELIHLGELVTQVAAELATHIGDDCLIYTEEVDEACPVTAIPQLLRESLASLAQNAFDALPNGCGHIHIRVRCEQPWSGRREKGIVLGSIEGDTCTVLEVQDDGEGMPAAVLTRIFDPFFTTRLRAQGLGLTPVVGLIHSCRVALQILSKEGEGTTVRLCFEE
jgi:signal transduction histidine kinase